MVCARTSQLLRKNPFLYIFHLTRCIIHIRVRRSVSIADQQRAWRRRRPWPRLWGRENCTQGICLRRSQYIGTATNFVLHTHNRGARFVCVAVADLPRAISCCSRLVKDLRKRISCLQCCNSQAWGATALLDNADKRLPISASRPVWVVSHPKCCYDFGLPSSAAGAWQ